MRITAQVVTGRLEELYWDKVPERIRMDAMGCMQQQGAAAREQPMKAPLDVKRKRRKKLA